MVPVFICRTVSLELIPYGAIPVQHRYSGEGLGPASSDVTSLLPLHGKPPITEEWNKMRGWGEGAWSGKIGSRGNWNLYIKEKKS